MLKYTFTFKKGDVNLEYVTTDKESMERRFQIWVTCASVWAYNQDKIEKGLMPAPMPKAEKPVVKQEPEQEIVTEIKTETNGQPPTTEVEEQTVEAE